jgi:enoyl-CoA hydratase/carnithine racemase
MTSVEIQIISKLFDFLGAYKADELTAAATSPLVTANVHDALVALAKARAEAPTVRTPAAPDNGATNSTPRTLKALEAHLYAVLGDRDSTRSAAELGEILARVHVHVRVGPKDGRSRVIERLRRELSRLPAKEREQKVRLVLRELRPNQTEGWFKVIRGES